MNFRFGAKEQSKKKNSVGLDIGTHSIKMIEVSISPEKISLVGLGMKDIAGGPKDGLSEAVKRLADESKIGSKDVNISVSGPSVIVRMIAMPKMSEEDLKSAIRFEAEKFMPFNINDCIVDFQTLKKDDKENKLNILLVAAKKDLIQDRIKIAEDAGFTVNVVDIDSFAMTNAFFKNMPAPGPEKSVALLNIGTSSANLTISGGGMISLVRDVAIGGNDLNAAISKRLGIPADAVEALKCSPGERAKEVIDSVKPVLSNLFDDAKLSFGYYENQSGRSVDEIYVSGGSSLLAGLADVFQETFGIQPNRWNPFQFMDMSSFAPGAAALDKIRDYFAVASGLALR